MSSYLKQRVELYKKKTDDTWETTAIVLDDAFNVTTRRILGKGRDGFNFSMDNANNLIHEQKFSGNGTETVFTLTHAPPSSFVDDDAKFKIFVDDVKQASTAFTISGSTLTFSSAPASGNENIDVRFSLLTAGDRIRIYWWQNRTTHQDSDLELEGTIETPAVNVADKNTYSIRGYTLFEALMNGMAFLTPDQTINKPHLAIIQVISSINRLYPTSDRKIYGESLAEWITVSNPFTGVGNPTEKLKDGAFPSQQYSFDYKRGTEAIEELSSREHTEDGQYIYMVLFQNSRYEFIWAPRPADPTGIITRVT